MNNKESEGWEERYHKVWAHYYGELPGEGAISSNAAKQAVKGLIKSLLQEERERVLTLIRESRRSELKESEVQLLDRHEREEYGENIIGYNQALSDLENKISE